MAYFRIHFKNLKKLVYTHRLLLSSFIFFFLFSFTVPFVLAIFQPGETLDPTCAPGDSGCTVQMLAHLADQTDFEGTLIVGDGGEDLVYTSGDDGRYNTYVGVGSGLSAIDADSTTAVGYQSLYNQQSGNANTALGYQSMYNQVDGFGNVGIGYQTLYAGTNSGGGNIAIGYGAMYANNSGFDNVGIGRYSLEDNTSGGDNAAVGFTSLSNNTTGSNNSAIGLASLLLNTTGSHNTGLGLQAGRSNTTGDRNIYVGAYSGFGMTTGTYNTIIGSNPNITGNGVTTGSYNTIIGGQISGLSPTLANTVILADGAGNQRIYVDSSGNVGIGTTSPTSKLEVNGDIKITAGSGGTLYFSDGSGMTTAAASSTGMSSTTDLTFAADSDTNGSGVLIYSTSGTERMRVSNAGNVGIGTNSPSYSLHVAGDVNISDTYKYRVNGTQSLYLPNQTSFTGSFVVGDGGGSLSHSSSTQGFYNTFTGIGAGNATTTGSSNSFFGYRSGYAHTNSFLNSFFGFEAGLSTTTGGGNIFIGARTGRSNTTGFQNTFIGQDTGYSNVDGYNNLMLGINAGYSNVSGISNTFVGVSSGQLTTGSRNTFFGNYAGINVTTGTDNTIVGYSLFDNTISTGSKNTIIGSNITVSNVSNRIIIADGDGNQRIYVDDTGKVGFGDTTPDYGLDVVADINSDDCFREAGVQVAGTCASDERLKHNINSLNGSLDKVMKLRPVSFEWNEDVENLGGTFRYVPGRQVGLIAQEVQNVFPNLVKEKNGYLSIAYNLELQMVAINAIQELNLKLTPLTSLDISNPNSLGSLVKTFLADSANTIQSIFTNRVTTKEICVDADTCLNEEDIRNLINEVHGSASVITPVTESISENPDSVSEPEPVPEVVPDTNQAPEEIDTNTPGIEEVL
jgi:hypothetical protein